MELSALKLMDLSPFGWPLFAMDETPNAGNGATADGNPTNQDEPDPNHDGNVIFNGDPESVAYMMEIWNQLKERAKENEKLQDDVCFASGFLPCLDAGRQLIRRTESLEFAG